jgi:UDP-glucose 4-epimerase
MKTDKVLITGSKGFVGRHLYKILSDADVSVVAVNDKVDITRMEELWQIESSEAIIHLASKTSLSDSLSNPYQNYYTNLLGTLNLLEFARIRKIKKFIYVSTYVYGQPKYLPIDEKHPVNPHSPYNKSKLLAERLCENYSQDFGIDIVTLRPFYIYGPNSRSYSFIPSAINQIKETGRVLLSNELTERDFLFVNDFAELIEAILRGYPIGYNVYNVGYGKSYTLKQVCDFLAKRLNKEIKINYDEEMRRCDIISMVADISKVSKTFNWRPSIDLEKGLELIVKNSG